MFSLNENKLTFIQLHLVSFWSEILLFITDNTAKIFIIFETLIDFE